MSFTDDTTTNKQRILTVIRFTMLHTLIFLLLFLTLGHLFYPAPGALEFHFARQILDGMIPYRDFLFEYPPLALPVFFLPALILDTYPAYSVSFALEMLFFDILLMVLITLLASHIKIPVKRALTVYTLLLIVTGPIVIARFDLLPAMLVVAALWAFSRGKNLITWSLLAFGVTAKLYPVIIVPLIALYLLRNRQFLKLAGGCVSFITTLVILNLPYYLLSPGGFISSFTYHTARGLQCESFYASIVLILKILGKAEVKSAFSYGSWNLVSPLADSFAGASFYVTAVLLCAIYAHYAWAIWRMPATHLTSEGIPVKETKLIIGYTALVVITFMVTGKVFSPQYLIWLFPLLPLIKSKWSATVWLIFAIIGIITQYIFPYKYVDYESFQTFYVLLLAFRNFIIPVLAVFIMLPGNTSRSTMNTD
ncbi:MAG: hypothetical protein ABIB93_04590, partial [Chloroflexota bacterium]